MQFAMNTKLSDSPSISAFFEGWQVGPNDLIVTNEYILAPKLGAAKLPCDVLYQEKYGTGEPTEDMVDKMLAAASSKQYDRVIAIGGGAVIDIAKFFVFGSGLTCEEIFAQGATLPRKRKIVVVPTTCGTGSEVTMITIVNFESKGTKMGLAVPALFPDEAVLIPDMLSSLPYEVFAASSIDALIHAVESYISPKASPFSRAFGRDAIEKIVRGYRAMTPGKLPGDMGPFLTASTMAGVAFGNAGVGAVHAMAYPIGSIYHVSHGKANFMMFRAVFDTYKKLGADLAVLEEILAQVLECSAADAFKTLFDLIERVLPRQGISTLGVDEAKCREMAASVVKNQQRLLVNNPIEVSEEEIARTYIACL